jgi:DNA-binding MarR family transcriptional regulator
MKAPTRKRQLEAAIETADLAARDYRVWRELFRRVDWTSDDALIADRWQPKSVDELADRCRMSRASVKRALRNLDDLGWIVRSQEKRGRGYAVHYQLDIGRDQPARPKAEPTGDAERARRYRARKKGGQPAVTQESSKGGQIAVTQDEETGQECVTKGFTSRDATAGQEPDLRKETRQGGRKEGRKEGRKRPR